MSEHHIRTRHQQRSPHRQARSYRTHPLASTPISRETLLPSPPLSAKTAGTEDHFDPWTEPRPHQIPHWPYSQPRAMAHSSVASGSGTMQGLEGSWRLEGGSKDLIWDVNAPRDVPVVIPPPARLTDSLREREKMVPVPLPLPTGVWADVMDTSKGRDKVLKCLQYSLKTYLYVLGLVAGVRPLSPWFKSNSKRMRLAVSSLSLTRKCLILLNPLHPLTDLLSPTPTSASTMIAHLIDLFSGLSDDIYCLGRLGIVGKRTGSKASDWADRFWLLTTLMGLYKLHLTTIPKLLRAEVESTSPTREEESRPLREAKWTNRKLMADLVFASYDVFELTWFKEPIQCAAGMAAAFISTSKIYDSHWRASLGK